jgi:protein-disulfide isomerase
MEPEIEKTQEHEVSQSHREESTHTSLESQKKEMLSTPMAIIIAGLFIAVAVYLSGGRAGGVSGSNPVPKFMACLESNKFAQKIASDLENANAAGSRGTPFSVIIAPNGKRYEIPGAQPFAVVDKAVQDVLAGNPVVIPGIAAKDLSSTLDKMNPVSPTDHIRGNPNAKVIIVEYSDTECPFCKNFHTTMKQIMAKYQADNTVAWVYRHSPLTQLHPRAEHEAQALECAWAQGGEEKFWAYTDRIYEVTTSNNTLDPLQLPLIAAYVGLK